MHALTTEYDNFQKCHIDMAMRLTLISLVNSFNFNIYR